MCARVSSLTLTSLLGWFCVIGAVLGTGAALTSCGEWTPITRPAKPQLILEGSIRVEMMLDLQSRYVLTSSEVKDGEDDVPHRGYSIVDWKTGKRCELPSNVVRFTSPMFGPADRRKKSPLFLLPVARREDDTQALYFVDENCEVHGRTKYGLVANTMQNVTLDEDTREVLLYGNGKGVLAIADPWRDERTQIAEGVRSFSFVQRASAFSSPLLLWLIENNKLKQRALDGTEVLSMGNMVTEFAQVLFGELRVAFVDGGDLYEATGPDFVATRVAEAGCRPTYRGNTLELFRPCMERQLVRINLQSGEVTEFEKGVYESYTDTMYHFELQRDAKGQVHQWVEPPGGERKEIVPAFSGRPLVLDSRRLGGIKDLPKPKEAGAEEEPNADPDAGPKPEEKTRTFVIMDVTTGVDLPVLANIGEFFIFNDNRTSSYVWLAQHNVTESEEGHRVGELSMFGERDLTIRSVRQGVPERFPLGSTPTGVHGYSVEGPVNFTEPLIIVISEAEPLSSNPKLSRGKLEARLLSGDLGAVIADDVTSYFLITSPLPGVLYGIEEGEQPGLWFAAL